MRDSGQEQVALSSSGSKERMVLSCQWPKPVPKLMAFAVLKTIGNILLIEKKTYQKTLMHFLPTIPNNAGRKLNAGAGKIILFSVVVLPFAGVV